VAWQDRYQQGSLGGAEFYLERHSHQGKHRVATYKYPESNRVNYVKQGRDDFTFSMSAYVVGGKTGAVDYDIARERLWRILRTGGQVTLVHPYMGTVQVHIRSFSVSELSKTGNIAKFRMSLSQVFSSARRRPEDLPAVEGAVAYELAQASTLFKRELLFSEQKGLLQKLTPQELVDRSRPFLEGVFKVLAIASAGVDFTRDKLDKALVAVQGLQTGISTTVQFKRKLQALRSQQDRLILSAGELYVEIADLLTFGYDPYGGSSAQAYRRFGNMVRLASINVIDNNMHVRQWRAISQQEQDAQISLAQTNADVYGDVDDPSNPVHLTRFAAFNEMMRQATNMRFTDLSQLSDVETTSIGMVNERLQSETISTDMRRSLMRLKSSAIAFFQQSRGYLGREDVVTPAYDTNAILVSYNETGSLSKMDRIVQTNVVENPLKIVQGTSLKT